MNRRDWVKGVGVVAAGLAVRGVAWGQDAPVVTTTAGMVQGSRTASGAVFKAIPYGADTRGTRFLPPVKVASWKGMKMFADGWPPRAPQQQGGTRGAEPVGEAAKHYHLPADQGVQSEDCLYLNVWTPGADGKKRPVLVYIHGGAYNNGTVNAELYDGTRLAKQGVVVVTVNHRLNAFGYLELAEIAGPQYAESGNVGMLDLVLALEWVRDNIAAFGGDPGCVTIFGQSGGGAKCATLMAMPAAKGLFHRVWTMSGQQVWVPSRKLATEKAKVALAVMGISGPVTAEKLNALTMEQIQAGARTTGDWLPVWDDKVLFGDPFMPEAPKISASVPMVLGNTKDELQGGNAWRMAGLTWEELPGQLGTALKQFLGPYKVNAVIARYREWYPAYKPVDVFVAATAAFRSWPGQVIEAEKRVENVESAKRTWVYQMDYGSPTADGRAPHTIDIAFVFDNLRLSPGMVGASEADVAAGQPLATAMSGALVAFARTGDPNFVGLPRWPVYDLKARPTMEFDRVVKVVDDPRGDERRMMAGAGYRQPGTI